MTIHFGDQARKKKQAERERIFRNKQKAKKISKKYEEYMQLDSGDKQTKEDENNANYEDLVKTEIDLFNANVARKWKERVKEIESLKKEQKEKEEQNKQLVKERVKEIERLEKEQKEKEEQNKQLVVYTPPSVQPSPVQPQPVQPSPVQPSSAQPPKNSTKRRKSKKSLLQKIREVSMDIRYLNTLPSRKL